MRVNQPTANEVQSSDVSATKHAKHAEKSKESRKSNASADSSSPAASTEISSKAREMALAKDVASQSEPDQTREAKIAELKERIANKKYNVSPEMRDKIASKIVSEHKETSDLG